MHQPAKILVVDDIPANVKLLIDLLSLICGKRARSPWKAYGV